MTSPSTSPSNDSQGPDDAIAPGETHRHDQVLVPKPPRPRPPEKLMMYAGLSMPLLLMILLPLLYTWGLHSPSPRHMDVSIVGSSQETTQMASAMQAKVGSSFDFGVVPDVEAGKAAVMDLETRGAYDPATNTVYVASVGNLAAKQAAAAVLTDIGENIAGAEPTVVDLAPAPSSDSLGNTVMFIAIAAIMGGFLTATMIRLLLPDLGLRVELAILAVMSAIAGIIPTFIAYSVYAALSENVLGVSLLLSAFAFVIGAFHLGGMRLIGPAMVLPTMLIMLLFGVPASGGAIAPEMVPGFFTHLHSVLPTPALVEGLKRLVYFPDAALGATLTTLAVWAVIAIVLLVLAALKRPSEEEPLLTQFGPIPDPVEEETSSIEPSGPIETDGHDSPDPAKDVAQGDLR